MKPIAWLAIASWAAYVAGHRQGKQEGAITAGQQLAAVFTAGLLGGSRTRDTSSE